MSATAVAEVKGRAENIQASLPPDLLRLAWKLQAIGAGDGSFVEREERACEVLREMFQQTMSASLREHPLAQPELEYACPQCGRRMRIQRKDQHRKILSRFGAIPYNRPYGRCDHCGLSGAPLDWELGVWGQAISMGLLKRVCHAAIVGRSFDTAQEILREHSMVEMSAKHVRELAEREGRRLAQDRDAETKSYEEHRLAVAGPSTAPELLVVAADGGRVQIRPMEAAEWKEDKVGVVYDATARPQPRASLGEYEGAKAKVKTYAATMQPWKSFGWMLRLEAERRGYAEAKTRLFLADGASHIREMKKDHFWETVFILDWAHGAGHVADSAKAAFGEGTEKALRWDKEHRQMLWDGEVEKLIRDLEDLSTRLGPPRKDDPEGSPRRILHQNATSYFPNNKDVMDYPAYRAKGWPIGSGVAEGSVKQFALRVKGSEKFWNPGIELESSPSGEAKKRPDATGAEEMLALCALYYSEDGRWQKHWDERGQPRRWT